MRRDFNDFEIAVGALVAFLGFCGFVYLVFSLPELLGGLL
jgi:hypothetical protein